MKKPNLFIIGAPKCGTTSLALWLDRNPYVFMSELKEPNYFNTDIFVSNRMNSIQYLDLFANSNNHHVYNGEASTRYLYSRNACSNIMSFSPESKFIVLVRNPVEMVYSLHNHLVFLGVELEKNFKSAWSLSGLRAKGEQIHAECNDPDSLAYGEIGLLGKQVEHFFSVVPDSQRLVLFFDDLVENSELVHGQVMQFLDIRCECDVDFSATNKSMWHKSERVSDTVQWVAKIKEAFGMKKGLGLLNAINKMNRVERKREPLPENLRFEMIEYFYNDILKLEQLLERDLSHWVK